ncbi:MAG: type II toxin-antitoxin system PemK/MazF family toxin [Nitrospirae bacterium]|nr:type II toxin-antitoxin system PemK/MazF family toxin [Nitrospirota bacterium]
MKQKEIWLINLEPTIGAEIKKTRPCVIINDDSIGALPLKIIAPITDFKDKYRDVPWMVLVSPDKQNNLKKPSAIDVFQVRSVSEERLIKRMGVITDSALAGVANALRVVFGIVQ